MQKFETIYYKAVISLTPAAFFVLIFFSSFDIFITSLVMVMLFYMLLCLYYFKTEDPEFTLRMKTSLESICFHPRKSPLILQGFLCGFLIFSALLTWAKISNSSVRVPLPGGANKPAAILYAILTVPTYCFAYQLVTHAFSFRFVSATLGPLSAAALDGLVEFLPLAFANDNRGFHLLLLALIALRNWYFSREDFASSGLRRVGGALGAASAVGVALAVNERVDLLTFSAKNYFRFN